MYNPAQLSIFQPTQTRGNMTMRQFHILRSPKQNGAASADSIPYLEELGIDILDKTQPIQFNKNNEEIIHRWSPYVQGFSASFVQNTIEEYQSKYTNPIIFDPFAGSGTVLIQSKLHGFETYGVELNPLLHFIGKTKLKSWKVNAEQFSNIAAGLKFDKTSNAPAFLKSHKHFNAGVIKALEKIKGSIEKFDPASEQDVIIKELLLLAFSSILIDCSNLKRSPCLGYCKTKHVKDEDPINFFQKKISEISEDLKKLNKMGDSQQPDGLYLNDSRDFVHNMKYDLVITSPPYMNGLDYVMNYKIEMGWLNFADNHRELKSVKDKMVVCDNVSKGLIRNFSGDNSKYSNPWIDNIVKTIKQNILKRGSYRRQDMPEIVLKYFDDMHKIMKNTIEAIKPNGRFILVIGDSLIADEYVPTDLLIAKMGKEMGMKIEKIEKARNRRSGQIRSYKLRETIVTLHKSL